MPYTAKQLAFLRVAMHDMKRSKKERDEYRRMYNEGKNMPVASGHGNQKKPRQPKAGSKITWPGHPQNKSQKSPKRKPVPKMKKK